MFSYLLRLLLGRVSRNLLLIVGLLALSSGLSTYVSANQNATVRVRTAFDEHWRGAYDILVRPVDAAGLTEREHGLVESNYLSVGSSGIGVSQWKQIAQLPGVEVAAPVSTIGYLRNLASDMMISFPEQEETSLYRVSVAISSTNGYRATSLLRQNEYFLLRPLSRGETGVDAISMSTAGGGADGEAPGSVETTLRRPPVLWSLVAGIDPSAERRLTGLDGALVQGRYLGDNDGFTLDKVPKPGTAEAKALAAEEGGSYRQIMLNYSASPHGPYIPVIFASSSYISLPTAIRVDRLVTPDTETLNAARQASREGYGSGDNPFGKIGAQLRSYLDGLRQPVAREMLHSGFDYGAILQPMSYHALNVNLTEGATPIRVDRNLSPLGAGESFLQAFSDTGFGQVYRPGAIGYHQIEAPSGYDGARLSLAAVPRPEAQTIISVTGEVAFRSLPQAAPAMARAQTAEEAEDFKSPFSFRELGVYDLDKLPERIRRPDPLSYVPLGIYQPPLVRLVLDAAGNPLPRGPVILHPTLNPASFIPGPPLALTNIAAARYFRGENCIDAIRVRVAGIDRYTPENVRKVEAVAAAIVQSTGLRVDVVAGSSPQQVLVYVPGGGDGSVAPLGYVEEGWTTLGAVPAVEAGVDGATFVMLGTITVAGLLYLIGQSVLATLSRRKELALLQAVGWRRRHVVGLLAGEAALFGLAAGLCAVVLALLLASMLGLLAPVAQALSVGLLVFGLYVLASLGPALWIVRQAPGELLRRGEVTTAWGRRGQAWPHAGSAGRLGLVGYAWRNISRRRTRALVAIAAVAVATGLLMMLAAALVSLGGVLRVTLLGQFVGLEIQPYHFIMVASAVVISILTVGDHLALSVLERRQELALLRAVGWRQAHLSRSLLLEGLWLGGIGVSLGAGLAVVAGLSTRNHLLFGAWWVMPLGMGVMLGLCWLSGLYAGRLIHSRRPAEALHE